jgi:hypothetical protein
VSVTDEYLVNNRRYAATFSGPLPLPPSRQVTDAVRGFVLDFAAAFLEGRLTPGPHARGAGAAAGAPPVPRNRSDPAPRGRLA